jgi:hypothetical protein
MTERNQNDQRVVEYKSKQKRVFNSFITTAFGPFTASSRQNIEKKKKISWAIK